MHKQLRGLNKILVMKMPNIRIDLKNSFNEHIIEDMKEIVFIKENTRSGMFYLIPGIKV